MDISLLSSLNGIHYDEGNLDFLRPSPLHFNCGVQILCTCGTCILSTGAQQFHLREMSELIFWGGSIMQLMEASDNFHVRLLLYPKKIFLQAAISLDTTYFNYMREFPQYDHGEESWKNVTLWIDMAQLLFSRPSPAFRERLELNFLQSMLMWIFSSIPDTYVSKAESYTRKQLLFHKFMHLIHEHAAQMHQVSFYAEQLCISPRYLNEITLSFSNGKTPKALIDEQLTAELKVLLNNPALSIAEIASLCHFPDSSYLSRFFKKNTGIAPKAFRALKQN
ncbi:helix-turn-helix transcriptional regulator [Bacteroides mediterraneensis]|uniref:helix-turn-helix transcriptional regulator n=1 Tax=Bacteroides mediterraneensis TaxID=1841856 RepID=UPI000934BB84|nr:response regulator transcription factor [Bacteroides mediterraneensis]